MQKWRLEGFGPTPLLSWAKAVILLWLATGLILAARTNSLARPYWPGAPKTILERQAVLSYFLTTASIAEALESQGILNPRQFAFVEEVANQEYEGLRQLEAESLPIIQDETLSLEEKRARIAATGYNRRVMEILQASNEQLRLLLPPRSYARLVNWAEARWAQEVRLHGNVSPAEATAPRTYKIYATRYDSKGNYTVALPDMCLKFSNAGNKLCANKGYQINKGYSVYLSYDGQTAAEVWESGPWNVDDNYWATTKDPQPRRMFTDLALGMPEAQAAYFNGYNGGVDQFGRKVTAPFGIDLARQVSIDIGLKPGKNDWINVSFMWTDGWGGGKKSTKGGAENPAAAQPTVITIQTATPNPDGSLVHVVKPGEVLWNIAAVYKVPLDEIYRLNNLTPGAIIVPGQKIIIRQAQSTPTATVEMSATLTATITLTPSATILPTPPHPTPSETVSASETASQSITPSPIAGSGQASSRLDPLLIIIGVTAAAGTALLILGALSRRQS